MFESLLFPFERVYRARLQSAVCRMFLAGIIGGGKYNVLGRTAFVDDDKGVTTVCILEGTVGNVIVCVSACTDSYGTGSYHCRQVADHIVVRVHIDSLEITHVQVYGPEAG